jgi:hypothetical protein
MSGYVISGVSSREPRADCRDPLPTITVTTDAICLQNEHERLHRTPLNQAIGYSMRSAFALTAQVARSVDPLPITSL